MIQKITNFDNITKENMKKKSNWPGISDYLYRILIVAGSGSGKNALLNLINREPEIYTDKYI